MSIFKKKIENQKCVEKVSISINIDIDVLYKRKYSINK